MLHRVRCPSSLWVPSIRHPPNCVRVKPLFSSLSPFLKYKLAEIYSHSIYKKWLAEKFRDVTPKSSNVRMLKVVARVHIGAPRIAISFLIAHKSLFNIVYFEIIFRNVFSFTKVFWKETVLSSPFVPLLLWIFLRYPWQQGCNLNVSSIWQGDTHFLRVRSPGWASGSSH